MRRLLLAFAVVLVFGSALPASTIASSNGVDTASLRSGATLMVEGTVTSTSATTIDIVTLATSVFCRASLMCPFAIRAPLHYTVETQGATVFGAYPGSYDLQSVHAGTQVVVYGVLLMPATSPPGATAQSPIPVLDYGLISATGIFILQATPLEPPCLPMPVKFAKKAKVCPVPVPLPMSPSR